MNDKERALFRKALSAETAPLPDGFARRIAERAAAERRCRERLAERRFLTAAAAVAAVSAAATAAILYTVAGRAFTAAWHDTASAFAAGLPLFGYAIPTAAVIVLYGLLSQRISVWIEHKVGQ